jgi:hypothetical protein
MEKYPFIDQQVWGNAGGKPLKTTVKDTLKDRCLPSGRPFPASEYGGTKQK